MVLIKNIFEFVFAGAIAKLRVGRYTFVIRYIKDNSYKKDTRPVTVEYALTPYSDTLSEVIIAMHKWGKQHREKIIETP